MPEAIEEADDMDDHFWPAVYPGIAVGLMYGLAAGGLRNVIFGSLGGLIGAFVAFSFFASFFAEDGLLPLTALLAISLAGAFAVTRGAQRVLGGTGARGP